MSLKRHALRNDQWEKIKDIPPGQEGKVGANGKDNRLFVEAVIYKYSAGCSWRDLPERFGHFRVIHTRFFRWVKRGVWKQIFKELSVDVDDEYAMIDSTIVKAHQHSAGARKSNSKKKQKSSNRP